MTANPTGHPARYSPEIVDLLAEIINHEVTDWMNPPHLWDPFGGTGEALAELASRCCPGGVPLPFGGTEIEPEFIVDRHIIEGDATRWKFYPPALCASGWLEGNGRFLIVTSPTYPNGMADSWEIKDESKRFTYQAALDGLLETHRQLHPNNQARHGYRGTARGGKSKRREEYWRIADQAVSNWGGADMVLLNVSDFKAKGGTEPLVMDWRELLDEYGWTNQVEHPVATRRVGMGSDKSRDERVAHEVVVVAKRG